MKINKVRLLPNETVQFGNIAFIGGIHSARLNSEATIFRRRYYNNGAHLGFILYANDPNITGEVESEIKDKIEQSKGLGNFRNMFINIPKGDPEGVKLISVDEVSAKDEYANVKSISVQDILRAHRFHSGLAGIIPTNSAVMGNPDTARNTYRKDEIIPLQRKFMTGINSDPEIPAHLHLQFDVTGPVKDTGSAYLWRAESRICEFSKLNAPSAKHRPSFVNRNGRIKRLQIYPAPVGRLNAVTPLYSTRHTPIT